MPESSVLQFASLKLQISLGIEYRFSKVEEGGRGQFVTEMLVLVMKSLANN